MAPVESMSTSLARITRDGRRLHRPPGIEREIAGVRDLDPAVLCRRIAVGDARAAGYVSSEVLVHLLRRAVRASVATGDPAPVVDELASTLLRRAAVSLRGALRGYPVQVADDLREEVLGRLALLLVDPGDAADFFEVRFNLALKRLRIDVCRARTRVDRWCAPAAETELDLDRFRDPARRLTAEQAVCARQALARLSEDERRALVLHWFLGMPINARAAGDATLVAVLGVSERTVRNRLRRAEAKLAGQSQYPQGVAEEKRR